MLSEAPVAHVSKLRISKFEEISDILEAEGLVEQLSVGGSVVEIHTDVQMWPQ